MAAFEGNPLPADWYGSGAGYSQELVDSMKESGVIVEHRIMQVLSDGSGVCLSHGETFNAAEVESILEKGRRQQASGCGIRLIRKS
jgi:hypothetical protein